jgi:hypothetical protein
MALPGRLDPDDEIVTRSIWAGRPRFFWFVLVSSAILLGIFPFQLRQILAYGDTLRNFGWSANASPSGAIVSDVQPSGPVGGKLMPGDKLLAIDGDLRAARIGSYWFLDPKAAGERYTVEVQRDLSRVVIELRVAAIHVPGLRLWECLQFGSAVLFLLTGTMVGLAKPSELLVRYLYLADTLVAMFGASIACANVNWAGVGGWPLWINLALFSSLPLFHVFGYLFMSRFPQPVGRTRFWVFLDFSLVLAGTLIWVMGTSFNVLKGLPHQVVIGLMTLQPRINGFLAAAAGESAVSKLYAAVMWVAMATVGVRNYRLVPEGDQRRRLRWVFFGVIGAALPSALLLVFMFVLSVFSLNIETVGLEFMINSLNGVVSLLIPVTLAYAILRHRVLDIRVAIRMGIRHLLATNVLRVLFLLPLAALVYDLASQRDKSISALLFQTSIQWKLLIAIAVAAGSRYRRQLSAAIDRRFFRDAYNQEVILTALAESIKQIDSVEGIAALLSVEISKALHPRWIMVLHRRTRQSQLSVAYASDSSPLDLRDAAHAGVLEQLEQAGNPRSWRALRPNCPPAERPAFDHAGTNLLVPFMGTERRLLGVVLLGEKKSEEPYTAQDRALLKRAADEGGIVYENLELRGLVRRERQVQTDVLARIAGHDFNLVKECPSCGRCYDSSVAACSNDGSELSLSLPVERIIDGRYRLERLIGKGGMGAVYEAADLRLKRAVAVKVMTGRLFGDAAALRRFSREAQASARLVHPNIVRLYDYGELTGDGAFLVLELVHGVTWRRMLSEKGPLAADFASHLFEQLMAGAEAAHSAGIIHRDLKPDNVIIQGVDAALCVKILDFGLAKTCGYDFPDGTMTAPGVAMGTLGYMSPEQYLGANVDERSDVYAIGVMALETLTGKLQLNAYSFHTQIAELVRRRFDFVGSTPEHRRLAGCISKSVAIDPAERFRDIPDLRQAMLPAMRGCPPVPHQATVAATDADKGTKTL